MTAEKHHSNSPDDWIWKVIIMFITRRDLDLTETLAYRVPFLCMEQVAAGWWPEIRTRHVLKRRLEKLIGREWLVSFGSVDPYSEEFFGMRNDWWHSELRRHSERSQRFHDSHSFRRIWPHIKRSVTD